jgi:hypothetical protein
VGFLAEPVENQKTHASASLIILLVNFEKTTALELLQIFCTIAASKTFWHGE